MHKKTTVKETKNVSNEEDTPSGLSTGSASLPAREEAWNCNRCRDNRLIVWNGVATPCDRCAPVVAMAKAVVLAKAAAAAADYQASMDKAAEVFALVGSPALPQGTDSNELGGAGAPDVGGPSHDTGGAA